MTLWHSIMTLWHSIMTLWHSIMALWQHNDIMTQHNDIMTQHYDIMTLWHSIMTLWHGIMTLWQSIMTLWHNVMILSHSMMILSIATLSIATQCIMTLIISTLCIMTRHFSKNVQPSVATQTIKMTAIMPSAVRLIVVAPFFLPSAFIFSNNGWCDAIWPICTNSKNKNGFGEPFRLNAPRLDCKQGTLTEREGSVQLTSSSR